MQVTTPSGSDARLDPRRSVQLRWWLLLAAFLATVLAPALLRLQLPLPPMLAVLAALAGFNAWLQLRLQRGEDFPAGELFGQLCVDLVALAVLLYLSGGAANPLISLLLIPVAVAALALPGPHAAVITALAVAAYSLLTWRYLPLAIGEPERAAQLHLAGMWLTFVISAVMIAWFVVRMAASIRDRDRQLAAVREQALRDERVVALGAQAAGAAHELGTPLATIAVLVGELEHDPALGEDARADLALIKEQVASCKRIISGLAERSGATRMERLKAADAETWLRGVVARWHAMRPQAEARLEIRGQGGRPGLIPDPALEQAVSNLLNNAADADGSARIGLDWDDSGIVVAVSDHGPGFSRTVLGSKLREPIPSSRGGAGVGLMLALSAAEHCGGSLTLANLPDGGACATLRLPRRD